MEGTAEVRGTRRGGDGIDQAGEGTERRGIERVIVERVFVGMRAVCHERPFEVKRFPEQMFAFLRSGC